MPEAAPLPPTTSPTRILIVDDNEPVKRGIRNLLASRSDFIVCGEASDGAEAIEKALALRPDIILMDITMPRMDGLQATRAILRSLPQTRVILVSQNEASLVQQRAAEVGAHAAVTKPDLSQQLIPAIDRVRPSHTETHVEPPARENSAFLEFARRNLDRLGLMAQASQVGFWFCDLPFDKLVWDERVKDHFWLPPDAEVTIDTFYERLHPDDRLRTRETIAACINNDDAYDMEYRTVSPDGRIKWIRAMGRPFFNSLGQATRFDGLTIDVTTQKAAENVTGLLAAIVASSDDAIISKDLNGTITSWNKSAERIFGYTAEEAIGRNITLIIPKDRLKEERDILARIRRGERVEHFETVRRRKDGTTLDLSLTISPVLDAGGRVVGASKVARDITEKKRAERALRLSEERERKMTAEALATNAKFRAVFEQTTVFAGIMTTDGILIEANKLSVEACGYTTEEVLGKPFWETSWWRNCEESRNKIKAAAPLVAQGLPYREMLKYSWADGTERLVDFALFPIVDDQGQIIFLHPTGVDVTEEKRTEEGYRRLSETLDAEVQVRTRELEERNADVLRQSEQVRELSRRLLRAQDEERRRIARELHDSAGQTLTVLGMELGQLVQKTEQTDPAVASEIRITQELVQQLHRDIRTTSYLLHPPLLDENGLSSALNWYVQGLAERGGLEISLDIDKDLGRLPGDMELVVFRMVQECLTNIHRHSGSKKAWIQITRDAEAVSVEVKDQGQGIAPARLMEIQSGGSGVGIRGMRERLRHFQGKLSVESGSGGTTILATIPVPKPAIPQESPTVESSGVSV